jgi:hypothetical protein
MARRVGVTGGRDNYDYQFIDQVLRELLKSDDVLVHGDGNGVDRIAAQCAKYLGVKTEAHPAAWSSHGRKAGPIRNTEMVHSGLDLLVIFNGGAGTADMKRQATNAGIPTVQFLTSDD